MLKSFFHILFFQTIPVPIWIVLAFCLLGAFMVMSLLLRYFGSTEYSISTMYNRDVVFDILWQWDWKAGQINLNTLFPICPKCLFDMEELPHGTWFELKKDSPDPGPILDHGSQTNVKCDNCGFSRSFNKEQIELHKEVSRELIRRMRVGEDTKADQRIAAAKSIENTSSKNA